MRHSRLQPDFVDFIPEKLDEGVLYISRRYNTASHLCCCGCRLEVVTPLNPAKWQVIEHGDSTVSLMPSVGNWSFPCQSHYFVRRNGIQWATAFSPQLIAAIQAKDRLDVERLANTSQSPITRLLGTLQAGWTSLAKAFKEWMR